MGHFQKEDDQYLVLLFTPTKSFFSNTILGSLVKDSTQYKSQTTSDGSSGCCHD